MLNVSVSTVQRVAKVRKEGTPETIAAVESGQLPVSVATQHIAADDTEVLDLIDRVVQGKHAGNGSNQYASANVDNVHISTRPTGNDRQRALRKLRKDSPTLHAEVLAGKLSPHAAK